MDVVEFVPAMNVRLFPANQHFGETNVKTMHFLMLLALYFGANAVSAQQSPTMDTALTAREQVLIDWLEQRHEEILTDLKIHVEMNTSTDNIVGIDAYRRLMAAELQALGFATETHATAPVPVLNCAGGEMAFADHLIARREFAGAKRILLNGHMDTVFPLNDNFQTLLHDADGTLRGPGVADMKGGNIVMLYALKALAASGHLQRASITVLLNSDEEIGSLGSRALVETLAREHDIGLVFESSAFNKMTRARKGLGQVRLKVSGREAHSGAAHGDGVSANLELAHNIIAIEKLTDYSAKVTVNTGVMAGGEKRNTVAGCADAYIDLRYPTLAAGNRLIEQINVITAKPFTGNAKFPALPVVEHWAVLHRPAKEINATVDQLIAEATALSVLIGEPITGTHYSGGGTDGSIMQSVGLPTLDSLGVNGLGAHSAREKTSVKSLIARVKLAAVLISRQIEAKP